MVGPSGPALPLPPTRTMTAFTAVIGVVVGLAVGSFLNVVLYRVPRRESVVRPRSRCPGCQTPLADRDNVPVVSWLLLRGRCRTCAMPISARYPLVEAATAAAFGIMAAIWLTPVLQGYGS
ncbi:MAG: prepilin peptidase [Acidobacteria bacterium]|nr:prepilin peptidase [Acidobacteriota bacterium]